MTFSTNQNRQFYVVTNVATAADFKPKDKNTAAAVDGKETGAMAVKAISNGIGKELYFLYKGIETTLKSDRINVADIDYIKAIKADKLRTPFKSLKVTLDPNVNGSKLVANQDYVLRINLKQWIGMSEYDQYFKDAAVHVSADMVEAPEKFFEAMKSALDLSFSREIGATRQSNPYLDFKANSDNITITEKEQPWERGIEAQERVLFDVVPTTVYVPSDTIYGGDDLIWGKVEPVKIADITVSGTGKNGFGNGHQMADLEWFCMGERGDQYRMMGYPNYIPTKYMVDPSKEYNVLEIHYHFKDTGTTSYSSEKDITIVSDAVETINSLITAINAATGLTVEALPTA
jgi:hypothetical protein